MKLPENLRFEMTALETVGRVRLEQFAERIVRDCARICERVDSANARAGFVVPAKGLHAQQILESYGLTEESPHTPENVRSNAGLTKNRLSA